MSLLTARVGVLALILNHEGVASSVAKAEASGINLGQIIAALLPIVLQILAGGTPNFGSIISIIEGLIPTPAPSKTA